MGKRSAFRRRRQDYYPTPRGPVTALRGHLPRGVRFAEPCAGDGRLIDHLRAEIGAVCGYAGDVFPRRGDILWRDALALDEAALRSCDVIVTNPPWKRELLHEMIDRFSALRPTWLLFDADWPHTRQSSALMLRCAAVVPVGRVKWIARSKHTGKDNCCWYQFTADPRATVMHARAA